MRKIKKTKTLSASVSDKDTSTIPVNHWLRLSDEMVLSILRLLSKEDLGKVSLLNKKFRDLSRDNSLWTELTLDYQDIRQNAERCRRLVQRCKKLSIVWCLSSDENRERSFSAPFVGKMGRRSFPTEAGDLQGGAEH